VLVAAKSPLADATQLSGDFTVEIDKWRVPLKDPNGAAGAGRLTIHQLEADLGPLMRRLSDMLPALPTTVRMPPGTVVNFEVVDKQFRYRDVRFSLAGLDGQTQGVVGFDGQLDLSVELVPDLKTFTGRLIKQFFQRDKIALHVRGNAARPEFDFPKLSVGNEQLLEARENLLKTGQSAALEYMGVLQSKINGAPLPAGVRSGTLPEFDRGQLRGAADQLLQSGAEWLSNQTERIAKPALAPATPTAPSPAKPAAPGNPPTSESSYLPGAAREQLQAAADKLVTSGEKAAVGLLERLRLKVDDALGPMATVPAGTSVTPPQTPSSAEVPQSVQDAIHAAKAKGLEVLDKVQGQVQEKLDQSPLPKK
jgi:hypothetical protein